MIRGLIRLAMYFGFGYLALKYVNRLLINMGKTPITGARSFWGIVSNKRKNVIDLCPHCGTVKNFRHECR